MFPHFLSSLIILHVNKSLAGVKHGKLTHRSILVFELHRSCFADILRGPGNYTIASKQRHRRLWPSLSCPAELPLHLETELLVVNGLLDRHHSLRQSISSLLELLRVHGLGI